jgi:hypothetical protein
MDRDEWHDMKLMRQADLMPNTGELPEETRSELFMRIRMLERNTGKLRRCHMCGRVVIIARRFFAKMRRDRKRNYYCTYCMIDNNLESGKFKNMKQEKPDWYDASKKRSDELQKYYKPFWEDYIKQINQGVKIYKLEEKTDMTALSQARAFDKIK